MSLTPGRTLLDLSADDPETCQGKTVEINGAAYEVQRKLESVHAWVTYATRNARTGLSLFGLRIYCARPGSPHYAGMVREGATVPFANAAMLAAGLSDVFIPPLEVYEQNGGLVGLERVDPEVEPTDLRALNDRRQERIAEGRRLRLARQPEAALAIYEAMLAGNEHDSGLLQLKSLCLWEMGQHRQARSVALQAIDLEPNDTSLYRQLSAYHVLDGSTGDAFDTLVWGASRYCDFPTWAQMAELAVTLDRTEEAVALLDRGLWRLSGQGGWAARIEESRARTTVFQDALAPAGALQRRGEWLAALGHCERAIGLAKSDVLARVNAAICHFHLGDLSKVIDLAIPCANELRGPRALSALVLLLLATARLGDWASAKNMAMGIRERVGHDPFDLPTIPIAVAQAVREQSSVIPVLNVLRELPRRVEIPLPERAQLQTLVDLYLRRATKTDDLPPEPEWVRKL